MILVVVSTGHFDPLISQCNELSSRYEFFGQVGSSRVVPAFPHVKTLSQEDLMAKMREAELVVSHAGTGMLSMLYRLKQKTIVIPKQVRYGESNDGQVELAKKWGELGLAVLCMDVDDLEGAIQRCRATEAQFCAQPSLGKHLMSLL
ncbi:MAG: hypothetical protein HYR96_08275 [Deltaproteobacteria bacterium]|nr:hypothetical protein [Deltaproteobacteria bacterium]MBI3293503.1 hypothetical protein [Deltaproteobacteria bacterium]